MRRSIKIAENEQCIQCKRPMCVELMRVLPVVANPKSNKLQAIIMGYVCFQCEETNERQ